MLEVKQKPHLHTSWIDHDARDIVRMLQNAGFTTYLVGGCVRDLLAGLHPKDYDIATNAEPNQVRRKVWGSYVIGKRFRLVLVKRGDNQFEVSTFRRASQPEDFVEGEEVFGDNFFGTPEQDALRRDFTINALFYDPIKDEVLDYAHGMVDVQNRVLRMIGEPVTRILEDPIRSLRAVRLSHKLGFTIEETLRAAIQEKAKDVLLGLMPRRREEYIKILRLPQPTRVFSEMYDLNLLEHLLPSLHEVFKSPEQVDVFCECLRPISQLVSDPKDTVQLYTVLVWAFLNAKGRNQWPSDEAGSVLLDHFLKVELGVFKAEEANIRAVFIQMEYFKKVEIFKRRGYRRQQSLLANPYLDLSYHLACLSYELTPTEKVFWEEQLFSPPKPPPSTSHENKKSFQKPDKNR